MVYALGWVPWPAAARPPSSPAESARTAQHVMWRGQRHCSNVDKEANAQRGSGLRRAAESHGRDLIMGALRRAYLGILCCRVLLADGCLWYGKYVPIP